MDEAYGELRRDFGNFIDADLGASIYSKKLEAALEAAYDADKDIVKDVRLNVDVQDLQVLTNGCWSLIVDGVVVLYPQHNHRTLAAICIGVSSTILLKLCQHLRMLCVTRFLNTPTPKCARCCVLDSVCTLAWWVSLGPTMCLHASCSAAISIKWSRSTAL